MGGAGGAGAEVSFVGCCFAFSTELHENIVWSLAHRSSRLIFQVDAGSARCGQVLHDVRVRVVRIDAIGNDLVDHPLQMGCEQTVHLEIFRPEFSICCFLPNPDTYRGPAHPRIPVGPVVFGAAKSEKKSHRPLIPKRKTELDRRIRRWFDGLLPESVLESVQRCLRGAAFPSGGCSGKNRHDFSEFFSNFLIFWHAK